MTNKRQHIGISLLAALLMFALLLPNAVKLNHVFEDHKHEVCIDNTLSHLHEIELDCEFYKFNTTNHFFELANHDFSLLEEIASRKIFTYYSYLNSHRQLSFSLRGPPII